MNDSFHCVLVQLFEACGLPANDINVALENSSLKTQIEIYHQAVPQIEAKLWQQENINSLLPLFYKMFRDLETLIAMQGEDKRHHFIVVMPLADRPKHLQTCLDSLLSLCENFQYGGKNKQQYNKIKVLIADDSQQLNNINQHQKIVQYFNRQGLNVEYFGLIEQQQQLNKLDEKTLQNLASITGQYSAAVPGHKGASMMRNISYLHLQDMQKKKPRSLVYFIDSDQSFSVNKQTQGGDKNLQTINYFYYLDRIFTATNVQVLTGKVVGDPPVSPSVMAAKFMDDVIIFLQQIKSLSAMQTCQFHQYTVQADDGAYHDMGELFGLKSKQTTFDYHCELNGEHTHMQSLNAFAEKLNHFFDGEHPTRKTYYQYGDVMKSVQVARTVYTGNYILRADALKYFIPFATLKLRMAGPSLGRILKAELAEKFVSANLPMLHQRTVDSIGQAEFRAGVERHNDRIDLSNEFERQFFGDVMLFSIESLCRQSYPEVEFSYAQIMVVLISVQKDLLNKYQLKHQQIIEKIDQSMKLINDKSAWWNQLDELMDIRNNMNVFIKNMQHNFSESSSTYPLLENNEHIKKRLDDIAHAIMGFNDDRKNWQAVLL